MTVITEEIKNIINSPDTLKVLATVGKDGNVHVVFKGSIFVDEDGYIVYDEILEYSVTNRNVLYSLWFNKEVAINVLTQDKKSYQIKGIPEKAFVSGSFYEKHYAKIQQKNKDNDLATVYLIKPTEVIDQNFAVKKSEYEEAEPLYKHLDRLVN